MTRRRPDDADDERLSRDRENPPGQAPGTAAIPGGHSRHARGRLRLRLSAIRDPGLQVAGERPPVPLAERERRAIRVRTVADGDGTGRGAHLDAVVVAGAAVARLPPRDASGRWCGVSPPDRRPGKIAAWNVCLESVDTLIRAADPVALGASYHDCLGLDADENGLWRQGAGLTVFATFESETDYFGSRAQQTMANFRVRDLDAMLAQLRAKGADVAIRDSGHGGCRSIRLGHRS